jgi:hypothetical protein
MNLTIMVLLGAACIFGVFITPNDQLYMLLAYIIGIIFSSYNVGASIQVMVLEKNLEEVNLQMKQYYENQYKKLMEELKK